MLFIIVDLQGEAAEMAAQLANEIGGSVDHVLVSQGSSTDSMMMENIRLLLDFKNDVLKRRLETNFTDQTPKSLAKSQELRPQSPEPLPQQTLPPLSDVTISADSSTGPSRFKNTQFNYSTAGCRLDYLGHTWWLDTPSQKKSSRQDSPKIKSLFSMYSRGGFKTMSCIYRVDVLGYIVIWGLF